MTEFIYYLDNNIEDTVGLLTLSVNVYFPFFLISYFQDGTAFSMFFSITVICDHLYS